MIYRIFLIFSILLLDSAFCAQFGKYRYSGYMGVQQQMYAQRMNSQRMRARYNQSPTRNIRYPTSDNPYPNIQNTQNIPISRNYRYSPEYYKK